MKTPGLFSLLLCCGFTILLATRSEAQHDTLTPEDTAATAAHRESTAGDTSHEDRSPAGKTMDRAKGGIEGLTAGVLSYELYRSQGHPITVGKLLLSLLIVVAGFFLSGVLVRSFGRRFLTRTQLKRNTIASIEKTLSYLGIFIVVLIALRIVNIPLGAFAFLGGAVAIGIGFGAQNLINNFISGFIIMGERPISIGDLVEIEGTIGTIQQINARSTRILTGDNIHMLVPNSHFLENRIVNWTLSDRNVRIHVSVGVAYGSPVRKVEKLLLQAASEHDKINRDPEPFVRFTDFGDNALVFNIYFFSSIRQVMERWRIESDIRFRVSELFEQEGITIAFPQRDVHFDKDRPLTVKLAEGGLKSTPASTE